MSMHPACRSQPCYAPLHRKNPLTKQVQPHTKLPRTYRRAGQRRLLAYLVSKSDPNNNLKTDHATLTNGLLLHDDLQQQHIPATLAKTPPDKLPVTYTGEDPSCPDLCTIPTDRKSHSPAKWVPDVQTNRSNSWQPKRNRALAGAHTTQHCC
jgi:hypothetical protein